MALIELRDISKYYHLGEVKVDALRDVSLDIQSGEYLAWLGHRGQASPH